MPRILSDDDVLKSINRPSGLEQTPREILESHFNSIEAIPIKGGWGYTKDDAVIIDKDDHSVPKGLPFDGIGIEKIFVEKRTYEELIIFRKDGDKFNGINWELLNQSLVQDNDKYYDVLKYKICGHLDGDWEFLKEEFERNDFFSDDPEGKDNHFEEHSNRLICYETEFWFDITSFFGKSHKNNYPMKLLRKVTKWFNFHVLKKM